LSFINLPSFDHIIVRSAPGPAWRRLDECAETLLLS
jgi:hypothetical protein